MPSNSRIFLLVLSWRQENQGTVLADRANASPLSTLPGSFGYHCAFFASALFQNQEMIELRQLSKNYGDFAAVDDLSFKLVAGDVLGFLGPNGAGKSTTMKMITGFLRPSRGTVSIWGHDMWEDPMTAQQYIGYLPEGAPAWEEMTPQEFLTFIGEIRGKSGADLEECVANAVQTMSLASVLHQRIETLSKGFKRRVGLAQAILHDPDVLILDEPTDGLDPNQKHQVRQMIKGLSRDKIVIVSTHILEEVTAVCNRVIVLSSGRMVVDTTPDELLRRSEFHGAVALTLRDSSRIDEIAENLEALTSVARIIRAEGALTVFPAAQGDGTSDHNLYEQVAGLAGDGEWPVASIYQEKGRLDDVFRQLTAGVDR